MIADDDATPMDVEFDLLAEWTRQAVRQLGDEHALPAACQGSALHVGKRPLIVVVGVGMVHGDIPRGSSFMRADMTNVSIGTGGGRKAAERCGRSAHGSGNCEVGDIRFGERGGRCFRDGN